MRNLDSCRCWRCTLCPCKVRNKFLVNFWIRTILLCIPCIYHEFWVIFTKGKDKGSPYNRAWVSKRGSRGIALPVREPRHEEGMGWLAPRPGRFTPGERDPVPIVQEAGWAPGPVWTCAKNLAHTGIRSPDRPARTESLWRLSYRGPSFISCRRNYQNNNCGVQFPISYHRLIL
jgi:hypothetical protein